MKSVTFFIILLSGIAISTSSLANVYSAQSTYNVRIKSFQATTDGKTTQIVWELAEMDQGVACYLERSSDGLKFSKIGTYEIVEGFTGKMSALDKELKPGLYFYRLHMEKSGFIPFYSNIVSIRITGSEEAREIKLINPFRNHVTIQGKFSGNPLQIEVSDLNGTTRIYKMITPDAGAESISFDAAKLVTGVYIVRIKENALDAQRTILTKQIIRQAN